MSKLKIDLWQEVRDYVFITLGLMVYALAYTCFMLPYQITTGGVAGVASIIFYGTGFPVQYSYFIINVILLMAAIKVLGIKFCVKTIYAVFMLTFLLGVGQELFKNEQGELPRILGDQAFMACVIGACLDGLGVAIVFLNNGSTGGTDIIAAIVNKYRDVTFGRMLMYCDIIIISSSYFVFHGDWEKVLYGYCTLIIANLMIDYVMNSSQQSVQFFIFSKKYNEIADEVNQLNRGVTVLDGEGWYSKQSMKVLVILAKRRESVEIFRIVKRIDPDAFVSQSKVVGVYGEGFDRIKIKA